ncbi:MAG: MMPL family transporter, partial [Pseudomonadota bacterium]
MIAPLADFTHRASRALVSFSCRRARAVVAAALLLTAACGAYFALNVRINTDTTDMLNPELPFRKLSNEVSRAFPQFSDNILVVVEGDTPDLADESALKLAARLREKPELFGRVVDQGGDPFFRRHGLLYKSVEDLGDLSDRLARAQPFLGALWRDHTLRGLLAMLDLAAEEILKDPHNAPIEIGPALEAISDVIEAQRDGRFKLLSWQDIMTGEVSAPKDRRRFLLIQPALDHASLAPAGQATAEIRRLAAEMGLNPERGVQVRLTGSVALNQEEFKAVESGIGVAFLISLATVAVIVFAGLRSLRLGVAILLTLVMGLIWTGAIGIALFGELNLLSVAFVVLFVGLSDDFGIHFCLRYVEHLAAGEERQQALTRGGTEIGNALFLCTVTTAAGFFAFAPTDYRGLAQLGV